MHNFPLQIWEACSVASLLLDLFNALLGAFVLIIVFLGAPFRALSSCQCTKAYCLTLATEASLRKQLLKMKMLPGIAKTALILKKK